jgi:DNA modification methylase
MNDLLADGKVILHGGDCLDVLPTLPANSVDACVVDPPYHLTIVPLNSFGVQERAGGRSLREKAARTGFMGKTWDGGDIAFRPDVWRQVLRVLKPGGHLLSFGGTRTYHRMACAIEDAGFEIRDTIMWVYGSGFPKSHDVSKAIDKAAGAKRKVVGIRRYADGTNGHWGLSDKYAQDRHTKSLNRKSPKLESAPATAAARQWSGFGTALKPACEPIVLARKPLSESTVAANVLKWGAGALNIDGCRVGTDAGWSYPNGRGGEGWHGRQSLGSNLTESIAATAGRWPANIIHDGSDEVVALFPAQAGACAPSSGPKLRGVNTSVARGKYNGFKGAPSFHNDSGSAARFFYTAKADDDDRLGSRHPTVKPLDLMRWLVRLVTPPGGTVLDPFAGTGTTAEAAFREGMRAMLIEREAEYQADIRRRMLLAMAGNSERARETVKAKLQGKPIDLGPLFGGEQP